MVAGLVPAAEAGGVLELGHDLLGQGAGQYLSALGVVLGKEHGGGREPLVPAVLADGLDEGVQLPDVLTVDLCSGQFAVQVCEIAFQDGPVQLADVVSAHRGRGQERPEAGECPHAPGRGFCAQ